MRVSAIANYYRNNNTYSNYKKENVPQTTMTQSSQNRTYMTSVYGMKQASAVNFTGVQFSPIALVKKIPLEDRLADLFNISTAGDMIVAGKDLDTVQKVLKSSMKDFNHVIKRFFFVAEDGLDELAVFTRTPNESLEVFNPNK